jgi:two-component system NtrC family response regulator
VRILIVDDNDSLRWALARVLEDSGHEIVEAATLAAGRARLQADGYQVVMIDVHLRDGLGTTFVPEVRRRLPGCRVVLMSGTAPEEDLGGADLFLEKGGDPDEIIGQLERLTREG